MLTPTKATFCTAARWVWSKWQSITEFVSKYAKPIIFLLMLLNAFGMVAPETATAFRDAVLGLVV